MFSNITTLKFVNNQFSENQTIEYFVIHNVSFYFNKITKTTINILFLQKKL